jgi:hypothetical protein
MRLGLPPTWLENLDSISNDQGKKDISVDGECIHRRAWPDRRYLALMLVLYHDVHDCWPRSRGD